MHPALIQIFDDAISVPSPVLFQSTACRRIVLEQHCSFTSQPVATIAFSATLI